MEYVLQELGEQVAAARAAGRPLAIRGGGTRSFYAEPGAEAAARVLDMTAYHGVISYAPSELVITARAGTSLQDIEAMLAAENQMLAFEPPRFGAGGTLGGCVASGLSGPRRMAAGPLVDFVLGTRLLDGAGQVLGFGGEVMKNVAGYDVSRLLAGSLGVLGALLEVSVKVVPRPRSEQSCVLDVTAAEALALCRRWRTHPLPVSATAWLPGAGQSGRLHVRLSGNESAVRQGRERLGGDAMAPDEATAFWLGMRDQTHDFFEQRPLWRVALPVDAPELPFDGPQLHEWHGCQRWLAGEADAQALRSRVRALGGSVCLYRRGAVAQDVPTFHPLPAALLQIHRRLKQEFDPAGIFNPHRLVPDF